MSDARRNIVMITADSLRADHCGYIGGGGLTPTLDRLANEGVAFQNAIAPGPQTFSSVPITFTGQYRNADVFREQDDDENWQRRLEAISTHLDRHPPVQEHLAELGYTTAAVTPNPWTSGASGFQRGFDEFRDHSAGREESPLHRCAKLLPGIDPSSKPVEIALNKFSDSSFFAGWESFYNDVLAVREKLEEPYFLWVFLLDTHIPYITPRTYRVENSFPEMYYAVLRSYPAMRGYAEAPAAHVETRLKRSYRDAVRTVDGFLDRMLADLSGDDPTVVFHSDHGESFGEHTHYGHHHRRVFEENIHVPYVVYNGGATGLVERPVSLATVHDVVCDVARTGTFDPSDLTRDFVISTSELDNHRTVRGSRWKYIDEDDEKLFDLDTDPGEWTNLADERDDLRDALRRRLDVHDDHLAEANDLWKAADRLIDTARV